VLGEGITKYIEHLKQINSKGAGAISLPFGSVEYTLNSILSSL
jgi:hypothetical protein